MIQIDTRTNHDYKITENDFSQNSPFQIASETKMTCTSIFDRQHKQMGLIMITLYIQTTNRYHWNILSIISNHISNLYSV